MHVAWKATKDMPLIGFLSRGLLCLLQYIPRNMHTVFALLCFVVVIHWLIFPYTSGLLHWHCGNLTIAPVPAKQPWWIWINTSCEFIMNDCITTTKQSTTKPCVYFLGYIVIHGWMDPTYRTNRWYSFSTPQNKCCKLSVFPNISGCFCQHNNKGEIRWSFCLSVDI